LDVGAKPTSRRTIATPAFETCLSISAERRHDGARHPFLWRPWSEYRQAKPLAEDRNTPVVLGEIQRQIEACPAEPAYMKLSKSNHSSGASTSGRHCSRAQRRQSGVLQESLAVRFGKLADCKQFAHSGQYTCVDVLTSLEGNKRFRTWVCLGEVAALRDRRPKLAPHDRNAKNCRSETGARQPNPRECRGFSHIGNNTPETRLEQTGFEPKHALYMHRF
jgi:hypothetical protein